MTYYDINDKIFNIDNKVEYTKNIPSIVNSIRNILSTTTGSIPGHPTFGSNLPRFLFDLINPLTLANIKDSCLYSLSTWEPRIKIININVTGDPDYNRILINIKYTLKDDVNNSELSFIYKLSQ